MREQNPRRLPLLLLGVLGRLKPSMRWEEPLQGGRGAIGGLLVEPPPTRGHWRPVISSCRPATAFRPHLHDFSRCMALPMAALTAGPAQWGRQPGEGSG